jgi:hypothetical protein
MWALHQPVDKRQKKSIFCLKFNLDKEMKKVTKGKQRLFAQLNLAQKLNFSLISKKFTVSFSSNIYVTCN